MFSNDCLIYVRLSIVYWWAACFCFDAACTFTSKGAQRAVCMSIAATFFQAFNVPVFWPILVLYFFVLFGISMKQRIKHMIKYKYVHCLRWCCFVNDKKNTRLCWCVACGVWRAVCGVDIGACVRACAC